MIFLQIPIGPMKNFAYIIGDEESRTAVAVDPAWDVEKIIEAVNNHELTLKYVINTHSHSDHVSGNTKIAFKTNAKIVMHSKSTLQKDFTVDDGDILELGSLHIQFIHTPGHSPDSMSILIANKFLTGDTLFVGECGRTDLEGGSSEEMYYSLFNKISKLDDSLEVYPGHNYGDEPSSTLGYERKNNYTLQPRTKNEFIEFMKES